MSRYGISSFGAYVPRLRLDRRAIAAAHGWMAPALVGLAKGSRSFASWDEDVVTMAVEAGRDALGAGPRGELAELVLASTTAPYANLQNAALIAAALDLAGPIRPRDVGGSYQAGVGDLADALLGGVGDRLLIASDRLHAKPASVQEMTYGAAAAALRLGADKAIATLEGHGRISAIFVDSFRAADAPYDYVWEERWIRDEGYAKIIPQAVSPALAAAGIGIGEIDHLIFSSPLKGAAAHVARSLGYQGAITSALEDGCGFAGAAHPLLQLVATLEVATPGQRILLIGFGQGAEALVLRVTDAIGDLSPRRGVKGSLADGLATDSYLRMLSFYGEIELDWGMRGERTGKAALTALYRSEDQIFAFRAGRCRACGTVQFPQLTYCVNPACNAPAAQFDQLSLADEPSRVLTGTSDWLSYHPAPPLYTGFAQFDNGARLMMEIVDVGPEGLEIGMQLRCVFRIKEPDRVRRFNRYFWKVTPVTR